MPTKKTSKSSSSPLVAIIMGSDSDLPTMKPACDTLDQFAIPFMIEVVSAHRTPEKLKSFTQKAETKGIQVIIAGAGGAAHLPGMIASYTTLPVIGVPVNITPLKGLDALLSVVQMPAGVPVATVGVDNATNAGLLAARILGASKVTAAQKTKINTALKKKQKDQKTKVVKANQNLKKLLT